METLRAELIEAQKARTEFIRWKLVLVASIGAVGLGLTGSTVAPDSKLVLCCIPFVCVYVDTMCRHLSLRIHVIAAFLRGIYTEGSCLPAYEKFVGKTRQMEVHRYLLKWKLDAFALQAVLIPVSSSLINLFMLAYGYSFSNKLIFWSAVVGFICTSLVEVSYLVRRSAIDAVTLQP